MEDSKNQDRHKEIPDKNINKEALEIKKDREIILHLNGDLTSMMLHSRHG